MEAFGLLCGSVAGSGVKLNRAWAFQPFLRFGMTCCALAHRFTDLFNMLPPGLHVIVLCLFIRADDLWYWAVLSINV